MKKNMMRMFGAGSLVLALSGCMSFSVDSGTGGEQHAAATGSHGSGTVHGSYYGFKWSSWDPAKGGTLSRVEYHSNAFYDMAALFTIGLYVPQSVEWWQQGRTVSSHNAGNAKAALKAASGTRTGKSKKRR